MDLAEIAWRYRSSRAFYDAANHVLQRRAFYNPVLASYALHYNDAAGVARLLPHYKNEMAQTVGGYFRSPLLTVDVAEYEFNTYAHFEYAPLINARAHQLKSSGGVHGSAGLKAAEIQNVQFRAQYQRFLNYLLYRASSRTRAPLGVQLAAVYYLLLQERNDEAVQYFSAINPQALTAASSGNAMVDVKSEDELQLQYDYLRAYLDFFNPNGPTVALGMLLLCCCCFAADYMGLTVSVACGGPQPSPKSMQRTRS